MLHVLYGSMTVLLTCNATGRPVHKEESMEEEVIEDNSSELTLNQLEEEIQVTTFAKYSTNDVMVFHLRRI